MKTVKPEDLVEGDKYRVVKESGHEPSFRKGEIIKYYSKVVDHNEMGFFYSENECYKMEYIEGGPANPSPMLLEEYTPDTKPDEVLDNLDFLANFKAGVPHPPKGGG